MNVLAGRLRPDTGSVSLDGQHLPLGIPEAALDAGIAAVHQSPMLFERFTWEENLALGGFERSGAVIDMAAMIAQARALARDLGFELPPPGAMVAQCSVA